jgi:hypothetical protein
VCVCFFLKICGGDFLPLGNQKKQASDHRMGGFFFEKKLGQSQINLRKKKGLKLSELDNKFYHVTNIYSEVPKIFYFPL